MELEFQDREFLQSDGGNKYFRLSFYSIVLYILYISYILLEKITAISMLNYDKYCNIIYKITLFPIDNETAVVEKTPSNLCPKRTFLKR
jgi:hypothetical protein